MNAPAYTRAPRPVSIAARRFGRGRKLLPLGELRGKEANTEIRSPKSERSPKPDGRNAHGRLPPTAFSLVRTANKPGSRSQPTDFALRISRFGLPSPFLGIPQ